MKKFLSVFITVLMLVQMIYIPVSADAAKDVVFTLSEVSGKAGETVTVTLSVTTNTEDTYDSVALSGLSYDKDSLTFLGFSEYESFLANYSLNFSGFDSDKAAVYLAGLNFVSMTLVEFRLSGTVCKLSFKIADDAEDGTYTVGMTPIVKKGSKSYTSEVLSGAVKVYHDHNMTYTAAADAFCNAPGVKENWYCSICKTYFSDAAGDNVLPEIIIPMNPANHTGNTELRGVKGETCGDDGYTGDTYCKDCDAKLLTGTAIPATGAHTGGTATCIASKECSVCGQPYGDIDKNNHAGETEVRDYAAATCGDDGYTGDTYCLDCGEKIADGTTLPATGAHTGGTATCVTKAECTVCGAEYGELDPDNHAGETEVRDAETATCDADGYTGDTYCLDCNELILPGDVIPATGDHVDADSKWETDGKNHWYTCGCGTVFDKNAHEGGEATCVTKADCSICGASYGVENPDNHAGETELVDYAAPTCSEDGYTGDVYCVDCVTIITPGDVIPATGEHIDADSKWETDGKDHWHTCGCGTVFDKKAHEGGEATCTAKAVCEVCEAEYGDVNASNHKGETEVRDAKAVTCSEDGYTGDTYCKACNTKIADGDVIPATGDHVDADGKWDIAKKNHWHVCGCGEIFDKEEHKGGEATCTAKAVCEVCEAEYGDVNASNHKGETEVRDAKAVTCSEDGYTGDTYCLDCNTKIADGEVIPATGDHVDADGKWETDGDNHWHICGCGAEFDKAAHEGGEATCIAKAVCEACEEEYGDVNASNHKGETEVRDAKAATCSEDGYTGDTYCLDCDTKIADGEVIEATGEHVDADGKWDSDADNHWHICGCGAEFDKAAHKGGEATCIAKAKCEACEAEYGEINAKNHKNTEIRGAKEPTTTQPGETGETWCKDCDTKLKDSETIPAKGDSWDDWYWIMQQMQQKKSVITATAGEGGTISNAGRKTVMNGASMTYTITPADGYEIEAVYVNGLDIGAVNKYTFRKVMTNQTIHASFAKIGWKNPFTDVADDADYIDAIEFVYENELFIGTSDTTFEPETTMTRAMFVTVLGRMAGVEPVALPFTAFEDVVLDEWYAPYVDWAEEKGIVKGYGDGTFGVDDEITVEQAAVILARFAKYTEVYEASDLDLGEYDDGDEVSDWAAAEMKWALENEVYVPAGYKLAPTEPASRALIAIMLYNYVNELG